TTTNYGNVTPGQFLPAGASTVPLLEALSNLDVGTTYHFRMAGTNGSGLSVGADVAFTTAAPSAPAVTTLAASGVALDGAVLNGLVNPNGQLTLAWFEWGTTTNYGNVTSEQSISAGA